MSLPKFSFSFFEAHSREALDGVLGGAPYQRITAMTDMTGAGR